MPYLPDHLTILRSRIVSDPELRFTKGGAGAEPQAVCNFKVVTAKRVKNHATGKYEDGARQFMRCTAWSWLAERAAALPKGCPVLLVGNLEPDSWQDNEGNERVEWQLTLERIAIDVSLLEITDAGRGFVNLAWGKGQKREQPTPTGLEAAIGKSWDESDELPFVLSLEDGEAIYGLGRSKWQI